MSSSSPRRDLTISSKQHPPYPFPAPLVITASCSRGPKRCPVPQTSLSCQAAWTGWPLYLTQPKTSMEVRQSHPLSPQASGPHSQAQQPTSALAASQMMSHLLMISMSHFHRYSHDVVQHVIHHLWWHVWDVDAAAQGAPMAQDRLSHPMPCTPPWQGARGTGSPVASKAKHCLWVPKTPCMPRGRRGSQECGEVNPVTPP